MSDTKPNALSVNAYYNAGAEGKRIIAVSSALELIAARATSANGLNLEAEFENLSKYADQIQAAISKQ
ncbi:hypothetical protein HX810_20270 [Pseudomonas salomonii]|uniref:Uncharacterized protein n=1 Tax=Pseudomonas salomonii TaxID=191391 RepID=A0A7Y8GGU6_9PSED|nr:hypothetical protein [Pseudomonas salomonii]NWF10010.1 hypothetical protein [Pseudomonas salomonii]